MANNNRRDGKRRHLRMSNVNMPTGLSIPVTIPAQACNCSRECSFKVKLINLRPDGTFGRREFKIVSNQMTATIRQHALQEMGGGRFSAYNILSIEKVQNHCLWARFREKQRDIFAQGFKYCNERMLFHGTTAAEDIVREGFNKSLARPSGMFGTGIYFAEHSSKSNQYAYGLLGGTGCRTHRNKNCYVCDRKMLLCRVTLGKMHILEDSRPMATTPKGFHSVKGEPSVGGLVYPEYAVYDEDQVYPEYLITYTIVR